MATEPLQMPNNAKFALAIQQDSGQATDYAKMTNGYNQLVTTNSEYSFYALSSCGLAPVKTHGTLPPEIGGRALTAGAYATGAWGAGPVSIIPRLDDRLGWLLLAAFGDVSTVANTKASQLNLFPGGIHGNDAGIYSHIFRYNISDEYFVPWLSLRRTLPNTTAANIVGEQFQDGRLATFSLAATAGAPLMADMNFLARLNQSNYDFDYAPSWGTATYDDPDIFAVTSCDGSYVKIAGVAFDAVAVSVAAGNILLPPAQSLVIGSIDPKDFPNLGRAMSVTVTFLVDDWNFYVSVLKGASASGDANVACTVYSTDLDVMFASAEVITGTEPYKLRIATNPDENNAAWTLEPVRIVPNRPIVCQATCTVLAADTATNYPFYVILQNATTSYALP